MIFLHRLGIHRGLEEEVVRSSFCNRFSGCPLRFHGWLITLAAGLGSWISNLIWWCFHLRSLHQHTHKFPRRRFPLEAQLCRFCELFADFLRCIQFWRPKIRVVDPTCKLNLRTLWCIASVLDSWRPFTLRRRSARNWRSKDFHLIWKWIPLLWIRRMYSNWFHWLGFIYLELGLRCTAAVVFGALVISFCLAE